MNNLDKLAKPTKKRDNDLQTSAYANSVVDIASAYMSNPSNRVDISQIPTVMRTIAAEVSTLISGTPPTLPPPPAPTTSTNSSPVPYALPSNPTTHQPAIPIDKSIYPNNIYCLECGKPFMTLRRHLRDVHGLSEDEYRTKWGLPSSYPMVCEDYSAKRSRLAKERSSYFGKPATRSDD